MYISSVLTLSIVTSLGLLTIVCRTSYMLSIMRKSCWLFRSWYCKQTVDKLKFALTLLCSHIVRLYGTKDNALSRKVFTFIARKLDSLGYYTPDEREPKHDNWKQNADICGNRNNAWVAPLYRKRRCSPENVCMGIHFLFISVY